VHRRPGNPDCLREVDQPHRFERGDVIQEFKRRLNHAAAVPFAGASRPINS